jgi:hypothetical protein
MMDNFDEYKKVINVPLSIIIASIIIIIVTTNMTDTNGLSALIGGYSGLLLGLLFVILLNQIFANTSYLDMIPMIVLMMIISLMIFYLAKYFERISKGEVSNYYSSFSLLSTVFLMTQIIIIFNSMYSRITNNNQLSNKLFSDTTYSLLGLFGVINMLIVLTIGIILHFYSTQG